MWVMIWSCDFGIFPGSGAYGEPQKTIDTVNKYRFVSKLYLALVFCPLQYVGYYFII
jgi:hypothetical protein